MYPVLFQVGPFTLHTYGVFVAAGFFLAIAFVLRQSRLQGLDQNRVLDLVFYITLSAIIGARVLFIIVEYPYFLENPIRIFKIWEGGLVFYGGLLLAVVVAIVYMKKNGLPILQVGDIIAPSMGIGQTVGRLGCISAGCCYGKDTDLPWGIVFKDPGSLVPLEKLGLYLHPTQAYSSLFNLALFLFLFLLLKRKRFDGQVLLAYGMLYPLIRSMIEFFRGDPRGTIIGGVFSTSQFISMGVFAVSLTLYVRLRRKKNSGHGTT